MATLERRGARVGLAIAAVGLGIVAYRLQRHDLHQSTLRSLPALAIGWIAVVAGLVASTRRRGNPTGLLMVAYGIATLVRPLQYSTNSLLFTVGLLLGQLNLALFAHVALAYPAGRLTDRLERCFVQVGYGVALAFPFATLLVHEAGTRLSYAPLAPDSAILIWGDASLARSVERAFVFVAYGVLATCFVALVARKLIRATPAARRILSPLLLAALLAASRALVEFVDTFVGGVPEGLRDDEYWLQIAGQAALPLMLLAGLLSSRLTVAHVADLVRELDRVPPGGLSAAFGRALADPSAEVVFWLSDRSGYVDGDGNDVVLPDGRGRALTPILDGGETLAALLHDPILLDDHEVVESAVAAAHLALQNAKLQAEVKAQLERVRESRARLVAAGDEQRRRIERDLHDGAQQRLVALAIELRTARRRLGAQIDPELEQVLEDAVGQLQQAVDELRELARGVHPALLTEAGLAAALESLASRTPLRVRLGSLPAGRLPAEIEAAAYFVACEALANAVKHARADSVKISAELNGGMLTLQIADDGVGGATAAPGSGLAGLADRVEAHGGALRVESPPGGGTRVSAELPCGS
jgi:signal transduction histidine kinase